MEHRVNKPKVFLSHSRADTSFIERMYDDLRKSQIEPWKDTFEIRHGKPWLKTIFEDGIPTCDSVMVYFTEHSIDSEMVKKEMDVGILQQVRDGGVAFLPYISNENLRIKLRPDIQTLQVMVWNDTNYKDLLPIVVAEVWHSYTERVIGITSQGERIKRLEAELELEKFKKNNTEDIFSVSEQKDFQYIYDALNRYSLLVIQEKYRKSICDEFIISNHKFQFNLLSMVTCLINEDSVEYTNSSVERTLLNRILKMEKASNPSDINRYSIIEFTEKKDEIMMFGLIDSIFVPPPQKNDSFISYIGTGFRYPYTIKYFRFRYWLAHSGLLPTDVEINPVK